MPDIEGAITPANLVAKFAGAGIHISERTLRERARQLGAFRQMGKAMFFMPEDIDALIDALKPKPKASGETAPAVSRWTEADTDKLIERLSPKRPRDRPKK
ncbi:hypothetical protein [Rhizobium sp. BK418]|uniref:hypothetical protein n=1 Tax=Rhizobium sp. BK418 TaxID=2512120 RepID=UPI00104901A1|nr:hypothetical protein [Rhizobium sp. BK418]TCR98612.1 hypothetical protein EV281_1082 [Rhizobium sp. BK418]